MRAAIGASRGALAGQVLTESLLLSLVGALFGLILSYWGSRVLVAFMTEGSVSLDLRPDLRVLSLALFVGVLTGILFGLAPTWHSSRQDPAVILQPGSRSLAGEAGTLGKVLIITQAALSLVLLLGAGLLVRTFQDLRSLDLGFKKDNLLEIIPHAKPGGHQNLDMNSYQSQLIERISNMPGVRSVGLADISIPNPQPWRETASPMSEDPHTGSRIMANGVRIWPGFFKTLGTRLIAGRDFEVADDERHPHLVIVSRSFAERLFVNGDALGKRVRFGFMPDLQNLQIVGVADDARLFDLREAAPPVIYFSYLQESQPYPVGALYVRANGNPEALAKPIGQEIESFGREYPIRTTTADQMMGRVLVNERVIAVLSGLFATLGLVLASIGLYGLMSYGVTPSHSRNRRSRRAGRTAGTRSLDDLAGNVCTNSLRHRDRHSCRPCRESAHRQHAFRTLTKRLVYYRDGLPFASCRSLLRRLPPRAQSLLYRPCRRPSHGIRTRWHVVDLLFRSPLFERSPLLSLATFFQSASVGRRLQSPKSSRLPECYMGCNSRGMGIFSAFTIDRDISSSISGRVPCHHPNRSNLCCRPSSRSSPCAWLVRWSRLTSHPIALPPRAKHARTMTADWRCPLVFAQPCLRRALVTRAIWWFRQVEFSMSTPGRAGTTGTTRRTQAVSS